MTDKKKLGQAPAFPVDELDFDANGVIMDESKGMSKRFYAACAAMRLPKKKIDSCIGGNLAATSEEILVRALYRIADELLKQEQQ